MCYLKSLSAIHLKKIQLPDFLGKELLVKMCKLIQNYTFEMDSHSNTCTMYI